MAEAVVQEIENSHKTKFPTFGDFQGLQVQTRDPLVS